MPTSACTRRCATAVSPTRRCQSAWIDAEEIEAKGAEALLCHCDGILVPGGFGDRGIEGNIQAIRYAREKHIPFLGLCLGMQCAVIEFARNVCGIDDASSLEFNPDRATGHRPDAGAEAVSEKGATMRLGLYPCKVEEGTLAYRCYNQPLVYERHRHRYEVNNTFRAQLAQAGMTFSGTSPDNRLVEIAELRSHPFFIGSQFHPEFKSRPNRAHPFFREFLPRRHHRPRATAGDGGSGECDMTRTNTNRHGRTRTFCLIERDAGWRPSLVEDAGPQPAARITRWLAVSAGRAGRFAVIRRWHP